MRLIVEPNLGWSPEYREKNCPGLVEALKVIAQMIDEGWYSGSDSPLGWDWQLFPEDTTENEHTEN